MFHATLKVINWWLHDVKKITTLKSMKRFEVLAWNSRWFYRLCFVLTICRLHTPAMDSLTIQSTPSNGQLSCCSLLWAIKAMYAGLIMVSVPPQCKPFCSPVFKSFFMCYREKYCEVKVTACLWKIQPQRETRPHHFRSWQIFTVPGLTNVPL